MEQPNLLADNKSPVKQKRLSILGLRGAGKSTFMAMLLKALSSRDFQSTWKISADTNDREDINQPSTNDLIFELENYIFTEQIYPPRTESVKPMNFTAEKDADWVTLIAGGRFKIKAGDVPGEAVLGRRGGERHRRFYENFVDDVSAIIFLIDPQELWKEDEKEIDYYPLLRSILTEALGSNDKIYVAFGVTKIDALPEAKFPKQEFPDIVRDAEEQNEETAKKIAEKIIGEAAIDWIEYHFKDRLSWWMLSATGFIEVNGNKVTQHKNREYTADSGKVITQSCITDKSKLKPLGIVEIVEWALDRIAYSEEKKRRLFTGALGRFFEDTVFSYYSRRNRNK